jgi:hypothetical protein
MTPDHPLSKLLGHPDSRFPADANPEQLSTWMLRLLDMDPVGKATIMVKENDYDDVDEVEDRFAQALALTRRTGRDVRIRVLPAQHPRATGRSSCSSASSTR